MSRQVTTLIQTAGKSKIIGMLHPVTFENILGMSYEKIATITKNYDFGTGCFDHMIGYFKI